MSPSQPLELERPRDLGELLATSFRVYLENFGTLVAIGAAVAVPIDVIVLGLGLEQLFSPYDPTPDTGEQVVLLVTPLLTALLITAMTAYVLLELDAGRRPAARPAIQRGLDVFAPLLVAELLALAGIALGFIMIVLPGIYLLVRWYFVPQAVVVENVRTTRALERSGELVGGSWWRVCGRVLVITLVGVFASGLLSLPFALVADAIDHSAPSLAGNVLSDALVAPFGALAATLVYFDLRARVRGAQVPGGVSGPPDPPGLPPTS